MIYLTVWSTHAANHRKTFQLLTMYRLKVGLQEQVPLISSMISTTFATYQTNVGFTSCHSVQDVRDVYLLYGIRMKLRHST